MLYHLQPNPTLIFSNRPHMLISPAGTFTICSSSGYSFSCFYNIYLSVPFNVNLFYFINILCLRPWLYGVIC